MAQLLNSTRFKSPTTAVVSFDVTIPATSVGSKLVCVAGGGALITAKLGGSGGTAFTKRTSSVNNREVAAQDIVDSGGSNTTINISLNGAENVDGYIFEFAGGALGNFIAGATEATPSSTTAGTCATGSVSTTGAAVLFAMFTLDEGSSTPPAGDAAWGFEPLGKQFANEFILPDTSKSKYWSMIGVSDQGSAGTFTAKSSASSSGRGQQSCVWAYEDLDTAHPTYTNPYSNIFAEENSLPGNLYTSWFGNGTNSSIAGYTDAMSYAPGDTVNFQVDSLNNAFTIDIYRFGFYNYAVFGARLKATVTGSPVAQPAPTINSYGGTVCAWSTTATWTIPADAVPGVYVYIMKQGASPAQGIFVVRSTTPSSRASKIMITPADLTWQAYNVWGSTNDSGALSGFTGRNLYMQAPAGSNATRAFAVSFDRPFGTVSSNSITYFWDSEAALINFLEANGYDMAYYSMIDLEKDITIPSKYQIAISSGHSEYWSSNVRDAYENARDAGTNLVFMSSNTALWHTRFDPADTNKRNMICYKDSLDLTGWDNTTKYDPIAYTGTWRDIRTVSGGVDNNDRRPESQMTGMWFIGNGTFEETAVVGADYGSLPVWRNTTAAATPTIGVRGTNTASVTTPASSMNIDQLASTQVGDLLVLAVTFTSSSFINYDVPFRFVRQTVTTGPNGQSVVLLAGYAANAGTVTHALSWSGTMNASAVMVAYSGAIWEDVDTSVLSDLGGTAAHTTRSISNAGANRWAVCVFGDNDVTGSSKTTSWIAGAGLTSRAQADNSASGAGPWSSTAIMDTNGAVSQGAHQYTATAQFANPQAFAGIMYIAPGVPLMYRTIGAEWDYVYDGEASTPTNLVRLSRQATPLRNQASDYNGANYNENALIYYGLSLYQAPSGALVFNTGSWRFAIGLSRFRRNLFDSGGDVDVIIQQATLNILRDLGMAPTTLLGTGANVNNTALVDPGSASSAAAYGLPVGVQTSYQNMYGSLPPTSFDNNDSTDYTLGTLFTSSVDGKAYGVRWYFPGTIPDTPVIALLYSWTSDGVGTEIMRTTFSNMQTGWNSVLFSSPATVSANTKYVVAVWTQDHYVSAAGTFQTSAITRGDLTAPATGSGTQNGKYEPGVGSPAYPTNTFNGGAYFADVLFLGSGGFEGWGFPIN